ncbi:hypothetical protein Acsp05_33630 [Actinokineospora sp. NBRC 105648]|nr:hypothetical protein Acsp05_33630 [Actinokineospora sp. NBRC 105648]
MRFGGVASPMLDQWGRHPLRLGGWGSAAVGWSGLPLGLALLEVVVHQGFWVLSCALWRRGRWPDWSPATGFPLSPAGSVGGWGVGQRTRQEKVAVPVAPLVLVAVTVTE